MTLRPMARQKGADEQNRGAQAYQVTPLAWRPGRVDRDSSAQRGRGAPPGLAGLLQRPAAQVRLVAGRASRGRVCH
jgi:hypothetical protein